MGLMLQKWSLCNQNCVNLCRVYAWPCIFATLCLYYPRLLANRTVQFGSSSRATARKETNMRALFLAIVSHRAIDQLVFRYNPRMNIRYLLTSNDFGTSLSML